MKFYIRLYIDRVAPRTIVVNAKTKEDAANIARGVCEVLDKEYSVAESEFVTAGTSSAEEITLEQAIIYAVTGTWPESE